MWILGLKGLSDISQPSQSLLLNPLPNNSLTMGMFCILVFAPIQSSLSLEIHFTCPEQKRKGSKMIITSGG